MKARMNIVIDSDVKKQLKMQAIEESRPASEIIEEAVKNYLNDKSTYKHGHH